MTKNKPILIGIPIAILVISGTLWLLGRPLDTETAAKYFTVPAKGEPLSSTKDRLSQDGYVRSEHLLSLYLFFMGKKEIAPGGYSLSPSSNTWNIASVLAREPKLIWITVPEGLRKEEIAAELSEPLGWNKAQKEQFVLDSGKGDLKEGIYFPDSYLIPRDEAPADVALRLKRRFDEVFIPYSKEALSKNIKWTTVVKIASLVQREAAGKGDMPLIAGVIWNRLEREMKLDIDATLQYAKGNENDGWWGKVSPEDKNSNSPYNTYIKKGLPPSPISNPGKDAIEAALYPQKTSCLYYLHDKNKKIHCAETFEEHKTNIEKYLR